MYYFWLVKKILGQEAKLIFYLEIMVLLTIFG